MTMLWRLLPFYLSSIAGTVLVAAWGAQILARGRRKARPPQDEALLRPPGHTLAEKLALHSEKILTPLGAVFLGSSLSGNSLWLLLEMVFRLSAHEESRKWIAENGLAGLWAAKGAPEAAAIFTIFLLTGTGRSWWGTRQVREGLRPRHRLRMGLQGEQAVAEELQVAVRGGYHVFHDLPGPKGNVDHLV